ncbi:DUF2309 domain-containing protein [Parageobacillus toebii]|uniref:DUF2309 domain-containing protein n=1 Tax=Parageobacillus toebii TaxID=153151 RepID=UPI0035B51302
MNTTTVSLERPNVHERRRENVATDINVNALVKNASKAIAPLWPIATFVARHPWMGLEHLSFEQVAHRLKLLRDIDLYPSMSMFRAAQRKGELNPKFLEMRLQRWLDEQPLTMPREEAERFCRAALLHEEIPNELLMSSSLKSLAAKMKDMRLRYDFKRLLIRPLSLLLEEQGEEKWARMLDHQMIKWCKLFLDESQASWTMPYREKGFYYAWRKLVINDPSLHKQQRERMQNLPHDAEEALRQALMLLGIPHGAMKDYLEAHLLSLPGWAGMLLWRSKQSGQAHLLLIDYLAIRLSLEWALIAPYLPFAKQKDDDETFLLPLLAAWMHWGGLTPKEWLQLPQAEQKARLSFAYRFDKIVRGKLWLEAWEDTQEAQLKEMITSHSQKNEPKQAVAQLIFCMDIRSEPFRRHLEQAGPFETYGCAGFFGLPIKTRELDSSHAHASCPVIVEPRHEVQEFTSAANEKEYRGRRNALLSVSHTFKKMKQHLLASLLLPEVSGPLLGLHTLARSIAPSGAGRVFRQFQDNWAQKPATELSINQESSFETTETTDLPVGFSTEEKVRYVYQLFKGIGLTSRFAPLVVICGHESTTTNNPYASSLDCGACGGAAGGFNARVFAALCNLKEVREGLAKEGIVIPEDTVFVAAEHMTTVDELCWLYVPTLSEAAQKAFDMLQGKLEKVSRNANNERLSKLPGLEGKKKDPLAEAHRRAEDWSEIRPEWGLAGNAALIIGRRELTKHCNLEGRVFLHSYDWRKDPSGEALANIIAGPVTVAQWINLQYYASAVAPHYYGSGSKTTQTVTAGIGVMQGNASDLLAGLPWQSVMASDEEIFHSPLRLLVIIEAPQQNIERLFEDDPHFRRKVKNGWLRLVSIDPDSGEWKAWR